MRYKLVDVLKLSRKYVEIAHHHAETNHDNQCSEYYMNSGLYEIKEETRELLSEIDRAIIQFSG